MDSRITCQGACERDAISCSVVEPSSALLACDAKSLATAASSTKASSRESFPAPLRSTMSCTRLFHCETGARALWDLGERLRVSHVEDGT